MNRVNFEDFQELRVARAHWLAGQPDHAFEAFERALEVRPDSVRALLEFAEVMGQSYQIEFAMEMIDEAAELAHDDPHVLLHVALTSHRVFRPRRGIELLAELDRRNQLPPQQLGELAILYEHCNELEAALNAIERCISSVPDQPEPQLVKARLLRTLGDTAAAVPLLERLQQDDSNELLHIRTLTELAVVRDIEGDYAGAIEVIEGARQRQRGLAHVGELQRKNQRINDDLSQLYTNLDHDTLSSWNAPRSALTSNCRGVAHLLGFPRSGTTLLERLFDRHPDIVSSPERAIFTGQILPLLGRDDEASFLTINRLNSVSSRQLAQLRRLYLDCHQSVADQSLAGRWLIDKNPNHTSLLAALYRLFPESVFLVAIRDPRDVIVSNYLRFFPLNEYSVSFLSWEGVAQQYAADMQIWLTMRSILGTRYVEIRYEDVVTDAQRAIAPALHQCGLHEVPGGLAHATSPNESLANSPTRADASRPIHHRAVGRWRNYAAFIEPLIPQIDFAIQQFGYD